MDLLNRYLASVNQELPHDKKDDILREIKANILDEIEAKQETGVTQEEATIFVLNNYGHPTVTAQRFAPQSPLVAAQDMPLYKVVLWHGAAVIFVFALLATISSMLQSDSINPIRLLFQTAGGFLENVGLMLLVVTLSFYYLGKEGILDNWRYKDWSLDKLPMFPDAKIKLSDTLTDLSTSGFLLLLLWTPLWMTEEGQQSLILSLDPASEHWRLILTVLNIFSIMFALYRLTQSTWKRWSLVTYIFDHLAYAIAFLWIATQDSFVNIAHHELRQNLHDIGIYFESNFNDFMGVTGVIILFITAWQVRKLRQLLRHKK